MKTKRQSLKERHDIVDIMVDSFENRAVEVLKFMDRDSFVCGLYTKCIGITSVFSVLMLCVASIISSVDIDGIPGAVFSTFSILSIAAVFLLSALIFYFVLKNHSSNIYNIDVPRLKALVITTIKVRNELTLACSKLPFALETSTIERIAEYKIVTEFIRLKIDCGYYKPDTVKRAYDMVSVRDRVFDIVSNLDLGSIMTDGMRNYLNDKMTNIIGDLYSTSNMSSDEWVNNTRTRYISYINSISSSQKIDEVIVGLLDI